MNEKVIKKIEREIMEAIDDAWELGNKYKKYKGYVMMKVVINVLNKRILKSKKYLAVGPNVFIGNDDVEYDILIIDKNAKYELTVPRKYVKLVIECKTQGGYRLNKKVIELSKSLKRNYKKKINFVYLAGYSPVSQIEEYKGKNINAFGIKKYTPNKKGIYESLSEDKSLSDLSLKEFVNFLKGDLKL